MISEILDVASRPKLKKYISNNDITDLLNVIYTYCELYTIKKHSDLPVRDPKDLYILSLAETIPADTIISGDKDLLELDTNGRYNITTLVGFMSDI